ncbi:PUA-like domain-containing protein [Pseudoneurospora amorphoporcata]|uniref:Thymocyte nuclear protein 1 n=1 Tax=Pseudoneurospora amorphoporcata TaxID=241081 RepID=A0AAN6NUQ5_9PEZI|nr:PUA-like domain-containing protein [Pseudoneurospora amorphoporcata]
MKHSLFRTLTHRQAGYILHPSNFLLRNYPSRLQSLGTNNNIHFTSQPKPPTFPKTANPLPNRISTTSPINMPKRKSIHAEPEPEPERATRRRSSRLSKGAEPTEEVVAPVTVKKEDKPKPVRGGKAPRKVLVAVKEEEKEKDKNVEVRLQEPPSTKRSRTTTKSTSTSQPPTATIPSSSSSSSSSTSRQYFLLKAEPLPRLENGHDVSFSIDDLASRSTPEPWDGIRNYSARNNLRSMRRGDLAFFYHSNCPSPGIVGVMEIVKEAEADWTALDPKAAYYDPRAKKAVTEGKGNPWSLVHVEFREKFRKEIGLAELREWGRAGGPLEGMELLRMGRLSVCKVREAEWEFLMDKAGGRTGRGDGKGE